MGLFQMFKPQHDVKCAMNSMEAFAAICLVAIASDGYLSESEETEMSLRLSRMKLFQNSLDQLDHLKTYLVESLKKHGPNELIQSAKAALPPSLAPTAFTTAVDLVFSDGTVSVQEQAFVDDLRLILEIPDELALKIVEVITIKNQG
ncbi:MAG: tellurite resistance TerB family protein [Cyanobacteria bacterium P01_D01_bin.105]